MRIVCNVLLFMTLAASGFSSVVEVPADQPTIQAGIDAALAGDTVLVGPGASSETPYDVTHLFTLSGVGIEVSYKDRPTPTIAVNTNGDIAFATRPYTICVFSGDGRCSREIIDSSNVFPRDMLFDDSGLLQVLALDESRVIKYASDGVEDLPLSSVEDWWRYSDARIAEYLSKRRPRVFPADEKGPFGEFVAFPYYVEIIAGPEDLLYINGSDLSVCHYDGDDGCMVERRCPGSLFGALDSSAVLYMSLYDAYLYDLVDDTASEISLGDVEIHDTLPSGFHGNFPESNKRNLGLNWYWQRGSRNVYKVVQLPTGFRFFRISFEGIDN